VEGEVGLLGSCRSVRAVVEMAVGGAKSRLARPAGRGEHPPTPIQTTPRSDPFRPFLLSPGRQSSIDWMALVAPVRTVLPRGLVLCASSSSAIRRTRPVAARVRGLQTSASSPAPSSSASSSSSSPAGHAQPEAIRKLTEQLAAGSPRFPVRGDEVRILDEPKEFYQALLVSDPAPSRARAANCRMHARRADLQSDLVGGLYAEPDQECQAAARHQHTVHWCRAGRARASVCRTLTAAAHVLPLASFRSRADLPIEFRSQISALRTSLASKPNLKLTLLVDYHRSSREPYPTPSTASILYPLVRDFPGRVEAWFYRSPKLSGLMELVVPRRWDEGYGTWHSKIYGGDEEVIISGFVLPECISSARNAGLTYLADPAPICPRTTSLLARTATSTSATRFT